jgi:hypothetical protein
MYDDIDRMQLELTDLDFAIITSIDYDRRPCGEHGGGIKLSSKNSQQQNIEYFRNNLRGRIQGKNNDLRLPLRWVTSRLCKVAG